MKKYSLLIIALGLSLNSMAQAPKGPANKGMHFGETTNANGATDINILASTFTARDEQNVKVKGRVTDVCTMEGCWIKMQTANGKIMVKMKDHSFFVPVSLNGKEIVVDGTASLKETSVKELQHYAEDAGKTKEEIAAITEPKKEIVLNAKGILVL